MPAAIHEPRAISNDCSILCRACAIITVIDGHPATLSWLGAVAGHRTILHGVEHFGQTGTIGDLYRHFRLDRNALVASAMSLTAGRKTAAGQEALLFP